MHAAGTIQTWYICITKLNVCILLAPYRLGTCVSLSWIMYTAGAIHNCYMCITMFNVCTLLTPHRPGTCVSLSWMYARCWHHTNLVHVYHQVECLNAAGTIQAWFMCITKLNVCMLLAPYRHGTFVSLRGMYACCWHHTDVVHSYH